MNATPSGIDLSYFALTKAPGRQHRSVPHPFRFFLRKGWDRTTLNPRPLRVPSRVLGAPSFSRLHREKGGIARPLTRTRKKLENHDCKLSNRPLA
jgi:hypothetical protein